MGNIIESIESEVSKLLEESEKNSNMAADMMKAGMQEK